MGDDGVNVRAGVETVDGLRELISQWYTESLHGVTTLDKWEWLGFESEDAYRDHCFELRFWDHEPSRIDEGVDPVVKNHALALWHAANHFARDNRSSYTRRNTPTRIMYGSDWHILKSRISAVCYAMEDLVEDLTVKQKDPDGFRSLLLGDEGELPSAERLKRRCLRFWGSYRAHVDMDRNIPDGTLQEGSVITFWEETGEYYDMVQEHVGGLVAEFLLDEPDNPHAKRIAEALVKASDRTILTANEKYEDEHFNGKNPDDNPRYYWNGYKFQRMVNKVLGKNPPPRRRSRAERGTDSNK